MQGCLYRVSEILPWRKVPPEYGRCKRVFLHTTRILLQTVNHPPSFKRVTPSIFGARWRILSLEIEWFTLVKRSVAFLKLESRFSLFFLSFSMSISQPMHFEANRSWVLECQSTSLLSATGTVAFLRDLLALFIGQVWCWYSTLQVWECEQFHGLAIDGINESFVSSSRDRFRLRSFHESPSSSLTWARTDQCQGHGSTYSPWSSARPVSKTTWRGRAQSASIT